MTATVETSKARGTLTTGHVTNRVFTGEVEDMTKAMGEDIPGIHLNRGHIEKILKGEKVGMKSVTCDFSAFMNYCAYE